MSGSSSGRSAGLLRLLKSPSFRPAIFLLLAHLPFLIVYFRTLGQYDHYSFFPFALLTFPYLLRERLDLNRFRWSWFCTLLIIVDVALVVLGSLVESSWPVWAGFLCGVSACCLAARDRDHAGSLIHLVLPLLVLLRPPFAADLQLVGWLQKQTTVFASTILHRLSITHFRAGNVLEFPDKTLLVEEACSGIQSLFAVLFVAMFVLTWYRRQPLQAIVLLPMAFFWAGVFNVVRVLTIAIAWHNSQWDLSTGTQHSILGYICLAGATFMVISTDQLIGAFTSPIPALEERGSKQVVVRIWNWFFSPRELSGKSVRASIRPAPVLLRSTAATLALAVVLASGQVYAGYLKPDSDSVSQTSVESFTRQDLPEQLGEWKQNSYTTETRRVGSSFGEFSNSWEYKQGQQDDTAVIVSCDHSFLGWHNLEVCYEGRGWIVEDRQIVDEDSTGDWPAVGVEFSKPTGEHAYVIYSLFDTAGEVVRPPRSSVGASLANRIFLKAGLGQDVRLQSIQAQVFVETPERISDVQKTDLIQQHVATREQLRTRYMETAK